LNVDLVWLLDPKGKLFSSFDNDTDDAHYNHPASDALAAKLSVSRRSCARCSIRKVRCADAVNGAPHVIAAHTVLRSDRSGPAGGTLVFARRIGAPEIASIGADTQLDVQFAMLDDRSVAAEKPELLVAPTDAVSCAGPSAHRRPARLDTIDNRPLAVLYATLPRIVMQSGQQGVRYLVGWVALLISIVLAAWHAYHGSLQAHLAAAATSESRYRAIFDRAASGIVLFDPTTRRVLDANPQAQR
jgi:sensor domain CHASE-containing protein